jgi:DNA excision repair protein ERCC-5
VNTDGSVVSSSKSQQTSSPSASGGTRTPERPFSSSFHNLVSEGDDDEDLYTTTRLETALAFANAGPSPRRPVSQVSSGSSPVFGQPVLLNSAELRPHSVPSADPVIHNLSSSDDDMEEVITVDHTENSVLRANVQVTLLTPKASQSSPSCPHEAMQIPEADLDGHLDDVTSPSKKSSPDGEFDPPQRATHDRHVSFASTFPTVTDIAYPDNTLNLVEEGLSDPSNNTHTSPDATPSYQAGSFEDDIAGLPSPVAGASGSSAALSHTENWDAAQEMDVNAEEGEFVRFISQVKGRDLDAVRQEIDDEIKSLNQQRKAAMRDSEDITQQMNAQIMVRELQCLVDRCLTGKQAYASSIWYPLYYRPYGGRGAVC